MSPNEWIFGSSLECDVWVPETTVSAKHCSLRKSSSGYVLRDLESTNGTFVDGAKIRKPTAVKAASHVMLGGLITLPWPDPDGASRVVRFGRSAKNDYTIDAANVSTFHGEIIVGQSGTWVVVDRGSTNGIGLKQGHKFHVIRRAAMIGPNDTLLLGKTELRVQDITPLFRGTPAADSSRPASAGGRRRAHAGTPVAAPPVVKTAAVHPSPPDSGARRRLWWIVGGGVAAGALLFALLRLLR